MSAKVFISYRRDDSRYPARVVYDAFKRELSREDVFMDVDSVPLGVDFVEYLETRVNQCEILLALIGPGWVGSTDTKTGRRRLDNEHDWVRIEVRAALNRGIPVVPVLLDGAPMPDPEALPEDIRNLVRRQAEFVEYRTFDSDVERLIKRLGLRQASHVLNEPRASPEERRKIEEENARQLAQVQRPDSDVEARRETPPLPSPTPSFIQSRNRYIAGQIGSALLGLILATGLWIVAVILGVDKIKLSWPFADYDKNWMILSACVIAVLCGGARFVIKDRKYYAIALEAATIGGLWMVLWILFMSPRRWFDDTAFIVGGILWIVIVAMLIFNNVRKFGIR